MILLQIQSINQSLKIYAPPKLETSCSSISECCLGTDDSTADIEYKCQDSTCCASGKYSNNLRHHHFL